MFGEIAGHFKEGEEMLLKIRKLLGAEDPIYQKLETVMAVYENAYNNIESFVEKGKIIEDFQPDVLEQIIKVSEG